VEVIAGWTHKAFPIDDASRVGEARRHAAQAVADMAWNEVDAGRVALVVTELGTNLLRHANKGRLLIAARPQMHEIEIVSIDEGPGIENLALSMQDGHSSGSTPGTGLGAVRRLADEFDIHSAVPEGTVCVARVREARGRGAGETPGAQRLQIGALCLPAPYESVSGDAWAATVSDQGDAFWVLLADGLGHGPEAAKAGQAAAEVFAETPQRDLRDTLQQIHQRLQTTRGAAVCVLSLDTESGRIAWSGAGNVVGRVLSGTFDKSIVTQHGTAGMQIRKPETATLELPPHALVVLHSDGIEMRWQADRIRPLLQKDPTLVAAVLLRDHTRHRDDATVVVLRRKEWQ
jgi:anti-sigma regulatory factor (Ser/Thr protein kinase)